MECYKIENLSFTYPNRQNSAINDISVTIGHGEFITLCGQSGCGKTTLLRLLKSALAPFGSVSGSISFNGRPLSEANGREQAAEIGFVMQNPDNQIVTDKVWHELAFGLESLGYKTPEIRRRVSEMASFFGIETWFHKSVTELSGGQKQLLNLASVMVMKPSVIILDEPTSQLDPIAAGEFLHTLERINRDLGTTVILSEHRLEEVFAISGRVIVMDSGKIIADGTPSEVGAELKNHSMYFALPTPIRVHNAVKNDMKCPLTVCEGRQWLERYVSENETYPERIPKDTQNDGETVIELKDVWFRYDKEQPDIIKGINLTINKGELFAVLGGNAAGKTTLLSVISGLYTPYRGKVMINGQNLRKIKNLYNGLLGVLPQSPQSLFVKNTVYLDLAEMVSEMKLPYDERDARIKNAAELCGITELLKYHPYDLSGGEAQRAALTKVLLKSPQILILDEPTKGFDAYFKRIFAGILSELKAKGITIIMVSHDIEFCAEFADRCAMLFDGIMTSQSAPREFFAGNSFYTTNAHRMASTTIPNAVLTGDIIRALGGEERKIEPTQRSVPTHGDGSPVPRKTQEKNRPPVLSFLLILIAIPLTIYAGIYLFGDRKYHFISLLIILETLVPFCMRFESRKPKARELVTISVLCAIAVAGRVAFFMLPEFKPVLALVIISGAALGGEAGFLVGAVTGLVSGFFFGQGPWTPWQMFAFGIIGFFAGMLLRQRGANQNRVILCIFGFLVTFFVYGGIINPASVIMWQPNPTRDMIISAYMAGLPIDLVHAFATAFFLWFISKPMLEKLERIKIKHGLFL